MVLLSTLPLPLSPTRPPPGYDLDEHSMSKSSTISGFNIGIDERDIFLGQSRCVVCGNPSFTPGVLQHCYITKEPHTWLSLMARNWIPLQVNQNSQCEPCNGFVMCSNHHKLFDAYEFFIRFFPDSRKFVFINYSGDPDLQQFHGKAIALDIKDHHAPFPSLFIIHEMRVRGFHPFQPLSPAMPDDILWQDWISSDGVYDEARDVFIREGKNLLVQLQLPLQHGMTSTDDSASGPQAGSHALPLNADVISDILTATRAMPSWRACQIEGTDWSGTTKENVQRYVSSIDLQDQA